MSKTTADARAAKLGEKLRHARRSAGLSQAELGEFAGGIDRHLVAAFERGGVSIQVRRLLDVFDALGLEVDVRPIRGEQ